MDVTSCDNHPLRVHTGSGSVGLPQTNWADYILIIPLKLIDFILFHFLARTL